MHTNPWFIRHRALAPCRLRLICISYAGGGASVYRPWRGLLPAEVELIAVQLPGRETRIGEPALTSMDDLIEGLVEAIKPLLQQDFVLFGHSMGALVAFALARQLRRIGLPAPRKLIVSAHRAPQLKRRRPELHALSQAEFIAALRELNGTPEDVLDHAELMDLISPRLRADFALCENWRYSDEPPLGCALSAYAGSDDELDGSKLSAWSEQCSGPFSQKYFPGDHFYLHSQQAVLLAELRAEIGQLLQPVDGECMTEGRRAYG